MESSREIMEFLNYPTEDPEGEELRKVFYGREGTVDKELEGEGVRSCGEGTDGRKGGTEEEEAKSSTEGTSEKDEEEEDSQQTRTDSSC